MAITATISTGTLTWTLPAEMKSQTGDGGHKEQVEKDEEQTGMMMVGHLKTTGSMLSGQLWYQWYQAESS